MADYPEELDLAWDTMEAALIDLINMADEAGDEEASDMFDGALAMFNEWKAKQE